MLYNNIDNHESLKGKVAAVELAGVPRMGTLYESWFPEIEKIRSQELPWHGDLDAHLASIPAVVARLTPGYTRISIDFEAPQLRFYDSALSRRWVGQTLERVKKVSGVPVGLYDPFIRDANGAAARVFMPAAQDFLNPACNWTNLMVIEPQGDRTTLAYQLGGYAKALAMCLKSSRPIITDIACRDFWSGKGELLNPGVFRAAVNLARAFGDVCLWDAPATVEAVREASEALTRLKAIPDLF